MKVKIIGAGSIGNHLTQACRRMGWSVCIVDADPKALLRMKNDIYPTRYGAWDNSIKQYTPDTAPRGGFDIIMIGTPPHVRMAVALEMLAEKPKILQLEKPLCAPFDKNLRKFVAACKKQKTTKVIVGYDHSVAKAMHRVAELIANRITGEVKTIDVEFREHWDGIFKAHPWLKGPQDTYLGYWKKGGGSSGENSHALHLWQYLARISGFGVWKKMSAAMKMEKDGKVEYDSLAAFLFETDKKKIGRVVQDVVTKPTRKWARVQGENGFVEWIGGGHPTGGDIVHFAGADGVIKEEIFEKNRPDDFYQETLHIQDILCGNVSTQDSPLSFESALSVMSVLETAWKKRGSAMTAIR
jgi:predicted dehydrogenase